VRDLFKRPLAPEEVRELAELAPIRELFSWKSPTARQRGLKPDDLTDDELVALMIEEPRLIRRPVTRLGDRLIIGADLKQLGEIR
jgi:arsenate reductase-like glutaredoxin family protein